MNMKSVCLAVLLAGLSATSFAADQSIDLSSGSANFGSTKPLLDLGDDVLTFTGLASGTYKVSVTLSSSNILDLTGSLNGQALTLVPNLPIVFGYLSDYSTAAPLALTVFGTAVSKGTYAGTITASAVPEPETYALMLAGLGIVGFVASRRKAN
jgi:hypothetical protein